MDKIEQTPSDFFSTREILQQIEVIRKKFYITEMPKFRINASAPNFQNYKCRKSYFTSINALLDFINRESSPELNQKCSEYRNFVKTTISERGDIPSNWITTDDIKIADVFLDYLESVFKKQVQ